MPLLNIILSQYVYQTNNIVCMRREDKHQSKNCRNHTPHKQNMHKALYGMYI
jgi:hypothetical protein